MATAPQSTSWPAAAAHEALDVIRHEGHAWVYAAKVTIAALLALGIAFRLELESPRSAMVTVFIVMQPQSGMVIAKSFYRIIGTLMGSVATLVLFSLVPQQPVLFLLGLAAWVAFCTAGAARYRNFPSYGFILSGYTACLIGLPATAKPDAVLDLAVSRVSVVILGIIVSAFVSEILFPQQLTSTLVAVVRRRFADIEKLVHDMMRHTSPTRSFDDWQRGIASEIVAIEALRSTAIFESAEYLARSARVVLLNARIMSVHSSLHALSRLVRRLGTVEHGQEILTRVDPLNQGLADQLLIAGKSVGNAAEAHVAAERLKNFADTLPAARTELQKPVAGDPETLSLFLALFHLFNRFVGDLLAYTETYASLSTIRPTKKTTEGIGQFVPRTDSVLALLSGARAMAAVLILSAIWIYTAWPSAPNAVVIGSVLCALFATQLDPVAAISQFVYGFALALAVGLVFSFAVMPYLDGYPLLAAAAAPIILLSAYFGTMPRWAGMSAGFNLFFGTAVLPENLATYDAPRYLNDGLSFVMGVVAAALMFAIVFPPGSGIAPWRLRANLRHLSIEACADRLSGLLRRFESSAHDLLHQLSVMPRLKPAERAAMTDAVLARLSLGRAIIELRVTAADMDDEASVRLIRDRLIAFFRRPNTARHQAVIEETQRCLDVATRKCQHDPRAERVLAALHVCRSALFDDAPTLITTETPIGSSSHAT